MSNEENLKIVLKHLLSQKEHNSFYENYEAQNKIKNAEDFDNFLIAFKSHLVNLGKWDDDLMFTLKLIKEQSELVRHKKSKSPLFSINKSIELNDSWLNEFKREFQRCLTGDIFYEEIKPKRYKTVTENMILFGVNDEKLWELYSKYSDFNHPYVNYNISSILYKSKKFTDGLSILKEGIKSIASYPNHYWNNKNGIEGATWMIGDLILLLGNKLEENKLREEKIKLIKLVFLYMSRYICMSQSNIKSIDFYSNRARLIKNNNKEFLGIFGADINPDVQYISDMYLAYEVSLKNHIDGNQKFMQFMWDSLKMYRHCSHIPNYTDGYNEIEDKTWMELVSVGEVRSLILGDKLLKEFKNYELNISNHKIDTIFKILFKTKKIELEDSF